MIFGHPPGRPLRRISRDAISLYLEERFQWNLAQIFITWHRYSSREWTLLKGFEVRGQRLQRGHAHFSSGGIQLDGMASVEAHLYCSRWNEYACCKRHHQWTSWLQRCRTNETESACDVRRTTTSDRTGHCPYTRCLTPNCSPARYTHRAR